MKKIIFSLFACLLWQQSIADIPVVAITQIVSHPALNADYQGIIDVLEEAGYKDGESIKIRYEIAQGDSSIATQIAQRFVGEKPDVMVGISTPSAQTLAAASHGRLPIVFTAVTDPLEARLVQDLERPGKNITGVSDAVPLKANLELILEILPDTKTIGTIYNPGEANSVAAIRTLEEAAKDKNLKILHGPASKTSDVLDAARALVGKADVFFITTDNTAVSALSSIVQVAEAEKIPLFTADSSSVGQGAIAALGFSYYDIGRATGEQVVRILHGEKPADISVHFLEDGRIFLDLEAAKRMDTTINQDIIEKSTLITP